MDVPSHIFFKCFIVPGMDSLREKAPEFNQRAINYYHNSNATIDQEC